jgi:chromosome segregation ATPase
LNVLRVINNNNHMSVITTVVGAPPPSYEERRDILTRDYAQIKSSLTRNLTKLQAEESSLHEHLQKLTNQLDAEERDFGQWKAAWSDHKNAQYKEKRDRMEHKIAAIKSHIDRTHSDLANNARRQQKAQTVLAGATVANAEVQRSTVTLARS